VAPQLPGNQDWVVIAQVVGPRGNRGEVQAIPLCSGADRFRELGEVYLSREGQPESGDHRFLVEEAWEHKGRVVLKFRGVDSITEAERLRGFEVRVPLSARPALPEGQFYQSDLIGCEVHERSTGRVLGKVVEWQDLGGPALLRVEAEDGGELLIPFASSICTEIDPAARRVVVELPEGLKDLNR
jgi:16S rRNA processing protein RimM